MALTNIIRQVCKTCGKIAVQESKIRVGKTVILRLACGHSIVSVSAVSDTKALEAIAFSDGCKPRPYQLDAIRFAEESGFRCIIADEQGLGKTIEVLCDIRLHPEKLLPCIIACPTTVKRQWMGEIHRICGGPKDPKFLTQIIQSSKDRALPGFQIYIVTFDMLKNENMFEYLEEGTIKLLIIDECQKIKNHLSERAKAIQKIGKTVPHIIPMSGTPIKNHAGEYFTVLNLVAPHMFPHYQRYIDNYCDAYSNGWGQKVGGLKDSARFHEDTKDIIIRRTKADVLKDLPPIERKFFHCELNKKLYKEYEAAMKDLEDLMYGDESSFNQGSMMIAIYSRMRHTTGLSKIAECVDFVTEFLLSTDRKIVVFTHHQDVMGILEMELNKWCEDGGIDKVLKLHAGLDGNGRANLVEQFKNSGSRVMLASTLAAGEGLNLQFCSDAVILERQWNPANEEQAEARFHRFGQMNPVSVTYMIASGTIDEFFTELVEIKRSIVAATMDNKTIEWNQQSLMKELADILVTRGKKAWSI